MLPAHLATLHLSLLEVASQLQAQMFYAFGAFCLEGKILSTMDPKLDQEWKAEEAELVLKLGLLCSHGVAEGRPRMSQVLIYLKGQAALPENLNAHVKAQEGRGESENHAILCYSSPSLTITNSLISVGR
ncbi:hypothetical protein OIU78_013197 [Salix suchowensis]|nr:hypothetical protein OIU78_013197 [Salix suchowensis]